MKIHTIEIGRSVWKIRIWTPDFRKSTKVNIQSPKHNSAIYEDFSKILFEYENSPKSPLYKLFFKGVRHFDSSQNDQR